MANISTIENWVLACEELDPYTPPEIVARHVSIMGEVSNHPQFPDGKFIRISWPPQAFDRRAMQLTSYSGTIYQLGSINSDYLKQMNTTLEKALNFIEASVKPKD